MTNYYVFSSYLLNLKFSLNFLYFLDIDFSFDFFGLLLIFLCYFTGILSLFVLDVRFVYKNVKYIYYFNLFLIIIFFYVFCSNILIFFLFYEFLLLPSFLIVYFISPSRKAIQASLYFVIWTQLGSLLVLCFVTYILFTVGSGSYYIIRSYNFSNLEKLFLSSLLFFGFGFKVPIWPFHYWLTKTHVEAPSGFSMYLSGFLVKSAIFGFYKLNSLLGCSINTSLFTTICIVGVMDSSLKMWGQTDLKKLVAYGTIQEMNIIYLVFLIGDTYSIIGGILFCVTHGALSSLMFFLVDCVQKRFNSRSVIEVCSILHLTPMLGISILLMCILYAGLPGTLKFSCEFFIFSGLYEISPVICGILLFTANVLGLVGFSKVWFNSVFGLNLKNLYFLPFDLTSKELYIIYICCFFLVFYLFVACMF